ncbi:hypothetical protein BU15DRAFT_66321 [Melanogaster broomeanus]|nr:hypothetical protein BU15DRAFT_66321 [Melanogaster broomeanus]
MPAYDRSADHEDNHGPHLLACACQAKTSSGTGPGFSDWQAEHGLSHLKSLRELNSTASYMEVAFNFLIPELVPQAGSAQSQPFLSFLSTAIASTRLCTYVNVARSVLLPANYLSSALWDKLMRASVSGSVPPIYQSVNLPTPKNQRQDSSRICLGFYCENLSYHQIESSNRQGYLRLLVTSATTTMVPIIEEVQGGAQLWVLGVPAIRGLTLWI